MLERTMRSMRSLPGDDQRWNVRVPDAEVEPAAQLAQESALLQAAATDADRAPVAMLWRSSQCIAASPADRRLRGFDAATTAMAAAGWPVLQRQTGGTAVALTPDVLALSLIVPWRGAHPGINRGYQLLCDPILEALAHYGLAGDLGSVAHAICDGNFNIRIGARKLAGTSQRQAPRKGGGAMLLHAVIFIDVDVTLLARVVGEFYGRAGATADYRADALVSLAACVDEGPRAGLMRDFTAVLAGVLSRSVAAF